VAERVTRSNLEAVLDSDLQLKYTEEAFCFRLECLPDYENYLKVIQIWLTHPKTIPDAEFITASIKKFA